MRGFFAGRFQPFHRGHVQFVERTADEVDELVLGVGSAERSHTVENPFTAGERAEMISRALADRDVQSHVVPVRDIEQNAMWVALVVALCPRFEVVYSNNPLVERLFGEAGFDVRGMELYRRDEYRGTEIRRRVIAGEEWADLVPEPVRETIEEIDGVERLRTVAGDDVDGP